MKPAAISSNRVLTPGGMRKAVVLLQDGRIMDVLPALPAADLDVEDLGDLVLMPGIIDPHVHINEPGRTEWEGFDTATKAAIAGGVTTLVDMPLNSSPVTTSVDAFNKKIGAAGAGGREHGKLHCHCGFWGGIIPGNAKEIEPLIEKGVLGFKAFLVDSGINDFPNVMEADLRTAMPMIAKHGLPLLVHCELADHPGSQIASANRSYKHYLASRPKKWEDDAIALMTRLCEETGCRVHIVHLSSADSLEPISKAKEKGLPLTVETGQHYLFFNAEEISDGQTSFKCSPPIRERENNQKLWQALQNGIIDFVATDHSPAPPEMKEPGTGDFMNAWGGIASLQFALPALWTAAREHQCSLPDIARWLCANPARLPGFQNRKGRIEKGYDADLVAWDPEKKFPVEENRVLHKHKITPYLGRELHGAVEQTWLGGEKVFDRGHFGLNKGSLLFSDKKRG